MGVVRGVFSTCSFLVNTWTVKIEASSQLDGRWEAWRGRGEGWSSLTLIAPKVFG